jgi:LemA protein
MTKLVLAGLVLVLVVFCILAYNALVRARNAMHNAFVQIDVQLRRRYDLIPNLVETAKAYLKHERETLEQVIAARNQAMSAEKLLAANPGDARAMRSVSAAEGLLGSAMGRFMAVMEAYPDLKASANMQQLTEELTTTENKIAFARQAFNDAVMIYNNKREEFPSNVVAGWFRFAAAEPFSFASEKERIAPKVTF